ncbi:MAG TPA: Plug domain-containing protein [Gemmatimonadaceae bacterium]|nr:Plug domain-containing protein [Gemmatimonadaceae bacterium]
MAAILSPYAARAQATRDVAIRLHRAGDTTSIRGATVTIDHTIEAGTTDSAGIVRVPDLLDGGHIIEVVAHGYQAYFDNFTTSASIPQPIQLELLPITASDTAKAKGQQTSLTFAGFSARRAKGKGKFFTRAQLDAASGRPLANLLKMDAGAFIVSGPHGESQLAMRSPPSASSPCYAAVVRDGVRVYPFANASPPDLDKIFAEELSGIELYSRPAAAPPDLRDAGNCGVLVIWSRKP